MSFKCEILTKGLRIGEKYDCLLVNTVSCITCHTFVFTLFEETTHAKGMARVSM
jgi:hypothetical protein